MIVKIINQVVTSREEFNDRINLYLNNKYKLKSQSTDTAILQSKIHWFRIGFWFIFGGIGFIMFVGAILIIIGIIDILYQKSRQEQIILKLEKQYS
jgi:hypothetical protein